MKKRRRRKERKQSTAPVLNMVNLWARLGLVKDLAGGEYRLLVSNEEAKTIIKNIEG